MTSTFHYRATDASGRVTEGRISGRTEDQAADRVRRLGLRPLALTPRRPSLLERDFQIPGVGPRVKPAHLAVVTRQLATMVRSGVPLLHALDVLSQRSDSPHLGELLDQIRADVTAGESLSEAVARHPRVFDHLYVSMLRAGEAAGALDTVLAQLASTLERRVAIRQKVRSALTYPVAVLVMVMAVLIIMLVFVVPTFAGIYDDVGGTLPLPTRVLVTTSDLLVDNVVVAMAVAAGGTFALGRWRRTDAGRLRFDSMLLGAPLVGELLTKSAMARFGRTMGVLTRAGVPVLETLRIASATVGNAVVGRALDETADAVRRGETVAANLERHRVFPPVVVQLVGAGEHSGALEEMYDTIADSYEDEVETSVEGFASLIEPMMMAFIGAVVGGMVIALYLPMFQIIDLVQ